MPTFTSDLLPGNAGQNLGSASQPWNVYASNVVINGTLSSLTLASVASAPALTFDSTQASAWKVTLSGNVSTSSLIGTPAAGLLQFLVFQIVQDNTGGHTFSWPGVMKNAAPISTAANAVTTQMFYWDGATAWAISPGMTYP